MILSIPPTPGLTEMEFIRRHQATSDESPPWAGISFMLSIESDALSEKLRRAYPSCLTLRERKHQAAIDFLDWELKRMRSKEPISITPPDLGPPVTRVDEPKDIIEISPDRSRPQTASSSESHSASGSPHSAGVTDQVKTSPVTTTNPGLPQPTNPQQFVWSALSGKSMRPKTKRKMTPEERNVYKQVRMRGACETCKKQKGKCRHTIDGGLQSTILAETSKPTKRRNSSGPDFSQPEETKHIKTEQASDVHQPSPRKRHHSQSAIPTDHKILDHPYSNIERISGPAIGNEEWENGRGVEAPPEGSSSSSQPSDRGGSSQSFSEGPSPMQSPIHSAITTPAEPFTN